MNTGSFISYINRTRNLSISASYYATVELWRDWWEGYNNGFHHYNTTGPDGSVKGREMYTMRMAKRVCESWAALLMNEQTTLELSDRNSQAWLCGDENEGGLLSEMSFWDAANELVELAFRSGTGAFVMRLEGVKISGEKILRDEHSRIFVERLPAECILPITVTHGEIRDVAFMSEIMLNGKRCVYLETHILGKDGYTITNDFFEEGENDNFSPVAGPSGVLHTIHTHSSVPWFGIIRPNLVVNLPAAEQLPGMGMSVYANAIDQLKACDMAFNNFVRDFYLGGKKVFYDKRLIRYDASGHAIVPDDISQQLFVQLGDGSDLDGSRNPIVEYNPSLRVEDNRKGIQSALDYLSFECGFGTRYFRFDAGTGQVTATQYTGERQDMRQNVNKHQITIRTGLVRIIRALLYAGKNFLGANVDPDCDIRVLFDDSYISDSASERETDRQDVQDGLFAKWEYRMRWRGESEADAKKAVAEMGDVSDDDLLGFAPSLKSGTGGDA